MKNVLDQIQVRSRTGGRPTASQTLYLMHLQQEHSHLLPSFLLKIHVINSFVRTNQPGRLTKVRSYIPIPDQRQTGSQERERKGRRSRRKGPCSSPIVSSFPRLIKPALPSFPPHKHHTYSPTRNRSSKSQHPPRSKAIFRGHPQSFLSRKQSQPNQHLSTTLRGVSHRHHPRVTRRHPQAPRTLFSRKGAVDSFVFHARPRA